MNFDFTPDQQIFRQLARDFAREELAPYAAHWDAACIFPEDTLKKAAAMGFASIYIKEDIGGANLARVDAALVFEELALACVSTAAYLSIHNMASWIIDNYATAELRSRFGPVLTSMQSFASYCLTEPDAGSDAAALKTSAVLNGDTYIVNGSKAFISGGGVSDVYVCMVRTAVDPHHGISCLLIEKDTLGIKFGKKEVKLGWNSMPTAMVYFENCCVPQRNLIGELGQGFKIALSALNGGRVNIAACSLGGAKACLQLAQQYMHERQQFEHKLAEFQALQFKFADMLTEYETARLMVYRAAAALDQQHPQAVMYCAMAKRYATDAGFNICNEALQLYGGYGYLREYPIERYFRDVRVHQILEGSNEIMRNIIAKIALNESYIID